MNIPSTNSIRWPKWTLLTVFLLTVPVPYYMLVVGGMVPKFFIIFIAVQGLIVALPKFTAGGFLMLVILWALVAILGGLLSLAAHGITWLLLRILPYRDLKITSKNSIFQMEIVENGSGDSTRL